MNVLLVAGSRSYAGESQAKMEHIFSNASYVFDVKFDKVISGGARGIDTMAMRWAHNRGYTFLEFPADWEQHGKAAGYLRNVDMADACTHAIVVWDGESRGTQHTIKLLQARNRPYVVVHP